MWYTALLMGFAGSLHCAGMCSPLAMAVTQHKPFLINKVLYNSGRILIYATMGAIAASLGNVFIIEPYQGLISLLIGGIFLLMGIGAISGVRIPVLTPSVNRLTNYVKHQFNFWLQKKSNLAVAVMGMLNGLLPCGLTYFAITYCFIMPSASEGFLFMFIFGLGTWPVMIGFTWILNLGYGKLKLNYQKISSFVFIVIGIWLFARVWINHPMDNHLHLFGESAAEEVLCP
jgi:sulfite exporter TauE/SafE